MNIPSSWKVIITSLKTPWGTVAFNWAFLQPEGVSVVLWVSLGHNIKAPFVQASFPSVQIPRSRGSCCCQFAVTSDTEGAAARVWFMGAFISYSSALSWQETATRSKFEIHNQLLTCWAPSKCLQISFFGFIVISPFLWLIVTLQPLAWLHFCAVTQMMW